MFLKINERELSENATIKKFLQVQKEIELRQKQYEYYRNELLNFDC
jgi:restriction endonuclease S subunit